MRGARFGSRGAAARLAGFLVDVEIGAGRDHIGVAEARRGKRLGVGLDGDGAGDAAHPGGDVAGQLGRQRLFQRNVADGKAPARLEHAENLGKCRVLVVDEVQHAVGDDAVGAAVGERHGFDGGVMEGDVAIAISVSIVARQGYHLLRHVDADGLSSRPHGAGGEKHVEAAAGAEIDDGLARLQRGHGHGVAARQPHIGAVGQCGEIFRTIAEGRGDAGQSVRFSAEILARDLRVARPHRVLHAAHAQ